MFFTKILKLSSQSQQMVLASYYVSTMIEIATRKDSTVSLEDEFILEQLETLLSGLKKSWHSLYFEDNPFIFIEQYESKLSTINFLFRVFILKKISKATDTFSYEMFSVLHETEMSLV